jgi:DNA-binding transcriptional ArsR family regulator
MSPSTQLQTLKAQFFRALAHPVRIRLLEVLSARGEMTVQELQKTLSVDQPIVSQQLARLRASGIVASAKEGATMRYRLADEQISDLLMTAKQILNRHLVGVQSLLHELRSERTSGGGHRRA